MKELQGKTVFITGASSGIGWETALAFARRGCRVAVAARRTEKLAELNKKLKELGADTLVLTCDVQKKGQVQDAVNKVVARWGQLHILINNAGISDMHAFETQDLDRLEEVYKTNILGTVYASHAAIKHMRARGEGHIVNVASIAGLMGIPWMAVYSSSKFAMVGLTEGLRRELYGSGIRLTAFCPGTVDTAMAAEPLKDEKLRKRINPKTPQETAQRIVLAVERESPEVVFGEVSAFLLRSVKFIPRITDWIVHRIFSRIHPEVREILRGDRAASS